MTRGERESLLIRIAVKRGREREKGGRKIETGQENYEKMVRMWKFERIEVETETKVL